MTTVKERVITDSAGYLVKMMLSRFLLFAGSIIVARVLSPADYGIWKSIQLFLIYSLYAEWGIAEALNREIPYYTGKQEFSVVDRMKNAGYTFNWLNSIILSAAGFILILVVCKHYPPRAFNALIAGVIAFLLQQVYQYFEIMYRTGNNFAMLSSTRLWRSVADSIVAVFLAYLFGLTGRAWSYVLTYGLVVAIIYWRRDFKFKWQLDMGLSWELMKKGIPIMLVGLAYTFLTTVDKLMVVKFLGAKAMGYYSVGLMAINFVYLAPMVISEVLYPRISGRYGQTQDIKSLKNIVVEPTIVLAYLFPVLLGLVYLLMPISVALVLPEYIPGIRTSQILIMGMFYISLTTSFGNFLNTISKQNINIVFQIFFVVLSVLIDYFIIKSGGGILAVSVVSGVIYFTYLATISFYVYARFFGGIVEYLKFMFYTSMPMIACCLVLAGLDIFFGFEAGSGINYFLNLALKISIFLIFSGFLLYITNKKSNVITYLSMALKAKLR